MNGNYYRISSKVGAFRQKAINLDDYPEFYPETFPENEQYG